MAWFDPSWDARQKITGKAIYVDSNLTDVTFMVDLSNAGFLTVGFWDTPNLEESLVVTSSDGATRLPLDTGSLIFNTSTETGILFFKASLDSVSNSDFFLYYDNPIASQPARDAAYGLESVHPAAVSLRLQMWHTGNGADYDILDSTSNDNHAKRSGVISLVDGVFGKALKFEDLAVDPYLEILHSAELTGMTNLSMSAWIKQDTTPANYTSFIYKGDHDNTDHQYILQWDNSSPHKGRGIIYEVSNTVYKETRTNSGLSAATWYLLSCTWNGSTNTIKIYLDGVEQTSYSPTGTATGAIVSASTPMTIGIGAKDAGGQSCESSIHEVRIETTDRSAAWWKWRANNEGNNASTIIVGAKESYIPPLLSQVESQIPIYN
jgi:hypothetical protein